MSIDLHFYRAVLAMDLCLCVSVCLSVSLSVWSRSSTKTAKHRITQTTPHDSPGNLIFWCQRSPRNSTGVTPYGAPNSGRVGQNRRLSTNNRLYCITRKVQDRRVVSIKVQQEVVRALSNGGIAHDLECPLTTLPLHFLHSALPIIAS